MLGNVLVTYLFSLLILYKDVSANKDCENAIEVALGSNVTVDIGSGSVIYGSILGYELNL
jgi:hypothetical protein